MPMKNLIEYQPQNDPAPTRMDGKMTRHRSRWFHDTIKALHERHEYKLADYLETQFLAEYFGKDLPLSFPKEEFDRQFRACVENNLSSPLPQALPPPDASQTAIDSGMPRWFWVILSYMYARYESKLKTWIQFGADTEIPEDFIETLIECYNAEWGEGASIKPERLTGEEIPFNTDVFTRHAELFCFEELAKQYGNVEKVALIHREYERVGEIGIHLE